MEKFRTIYYQKYYSTFKKYLIQDDFEGAIKKSKQWFNKKYLPILKQYPSHSNILDIGCGMGIMLDFLRDNKYKNIEGVEVSNEQFEIAKKRGHKVYLEDAFYYLKKGKKELAHNDFLRAKGLGAESNYEHIMKKYYHKY